MAVAIPIPEPPPARAAQTARVGLRSGPVDAPLQLWGAAEPAAAVALARFVLAFPAWRDLDEAADALAATLGLPPLAPGRTPGPAPGAALQLGPARRALRPTPPLRVEPKPWGRVDVIADTGAVELVRLGIWPGGELPNHHHLQMLEWELTLDEGLRGWEGAEPEAPLPRGRVRRWAHGLEHGYVNRGAWPVGVLCLDAPRFDPADERIHPRGQRP
jgi:hypothetical protein